jgi:hypothetical protein
MQHTATITTTDIVPVVMRWDAFGDGYHYVGPFGSIPEANEWAIEHDADPCWHAELVNPGVPLEVRAPDGLADLVDDDEQPDRFADPVSDTEGAAFHLLMTDADPVHLVGPFQDQRIAYLWGLTNERRGGALGWQVVWLEDPAERPLMIPPAAAEGLE